MTMVLGQWYVWYGMAFYVIYYHGMVWIETCSRNWLKYVVGHWFFVYKHGMIQGLDWYGMVRYDIVWYGILWYGMA